MSKVGKKLATTDQGHIAIVGRQPVQCKCMWCGDYMRSDQPCITPEQRAFIRAFIKDNGRFWKRILGDQWLKAIGPSESIQLRNSRGPQWLEWFSGSKIQSPDAAIERRERTNRRFVLKQEDNQ